MLVGIGSVGKKEVAWPWSCCGGGQRGPSQVAGVFGVAVALAMALSACTASQPSGAAAARSSQPVSPPGTSCAWPAELDVQADNSLMAGSVAVDSTEAVWVQPIVASAGARIVLSGRFPDARYASLSVYAAGGGFVTSGSLPDYRIAPRPGSVNPWQRKAAPGGRFTVTIRPGASRGQANTLPLPPGTTSQHPGYLLYRVYVPAGGSFSHVPLPVLTVQQGRAARTLPACRSHNAPATILFKGLSAASGAGAGSNRRPAAVPPPLEFYTLPRSTTGAGLGDADTAYAWAYLIRPPATDVVVVTGKAPTFAPGSHPSPWPARGGGRPLLVDVHQRGNPHHPHRGQQATRGRDRLRMPR